MTRITNRFGEIAFKMFCIQTIQLFYKLKHTELRSPLLGSVISLQKSMKLGTNLVILLVCSVLFTHLCRF